MKDTSCFNRFKATCDIADQLTLNLQTNNIELMKIKSPKFVFVPNFTHPDSSRFKSYSGEVLSFNWNGTNKWWSIKTVSGQLIYYTENSGLPLGKNNWYNSQGIFYNNTRTALKKIFFLQNLIYIFC